MKKHLKIVSISTFSILFAQKCYAAVAAGGNVIKSDTIIVKFLIAMLGVIISIAVIWLCLKFYKKFVLNKNGSNFDKINYNNNLETPKDLKEAINLFLEKTDRN
jgi:hypothetical protein